MRSRDPGLLNSPNFDEFPPEFRDALRAAARQRLLDGGRHPADALQLQAGQGARGRARRARRGRAGRAAGAAGDGARRDSRVQPAAVRDRAAARHSHERAVEADARRLRAQPARGRCGHRARSASRRSRSRERARRSAARRERSVRRARAAEHGDGAPDNDADRAHRHARGRAVRGRVRCRGEGSADREARAAAAAHAGARAEPARRCHRRGHEAERRVQRFVRVRRAPAQESLRSGLLALVRRRSISRCRSSTAGAPPAAWRRRRASATP